jgi:hypothetical protein
MRFKLNDHKKCQPFIKCNKYDIKIQQLISEFKIRFNLFPSYNFIEKPAVT